MFSFVVTVLPLPTAAQVAKVYPVDEAVRDPEFFAFRARLLVALQQKDVNYLYSILAANILNSFGGDGGIEEFKATWKAEEPTSKIWNTVLKFLHLADSSDPQMNGRKARGHSLLRTRSQYSRAAARIRFCTAWLWAEV